MISRSPANDQYASALLAPNVSCRRLCRWVSSEVASSLASAPGAVVGVVAFLGGSAQHATAASRPSDAGIAGVIAPSLTPELARSDPPRCADFAISSLRLLELRPVALRRRASTSRNLLCDPGHLRDRKSTRLNSQS